MSDKRFFSAHTLDGDSLLIVARDPDHAVALVNAEGVLVAGGMRELAAEKAPAIRVAFEESPPGDDVSVQKLSECALGEWFTSDRRVW